MSLRIIHGDELPSWRPTITIDGVRDDYSTGHAFTVTIRNRDRGIVHTKTDDVTGHDDGSVTIDWQADELDALEPGTYTARLTIRRIIDDRDLSVDTMLRITT